MPWKQGQSGNPKGRAPQEECFKTVLKRILDSQQVKIELVNEKGEVYKKEYKCKRGTVREAMMTIVTLKALAGDLKASEMIMDRIDGTPVQSVNISPSVEISPLAKEIMELRNAVKNNNNNSHVKQ